MSSLNRSHYSPVSAMAINSVFPFMFLLFIYTSLLYCFYIAHPVAAITDPQEVEALKIIGKKLQNKKWNFSEDPCSGKGSWNVDPNKDTKNINMVICNYTSEDTKFHHVTHLLLKRQNLTGVVPAELANLTYLQEIDFTGNYLNGSIPRELGSLHYLQNLSLGINRLYSHIPKEIGNLLNLKKLDLFSNNLYGRLPKSLVNLTDLEKMYVQSNLFHGKIPKIYTHFSKLKEFYASSNNFSGKIPNFIGNWKTIKKLKLEASSLEGPIPSTFSSLSQLSELIITDLTGGGSNLSFMQNLTQLKIIVLRNALIVGKIPYSIGDFNQLKILDLRFNNLIGSIPPTLEKIITANIQYLYLGNNNLSGKPPTWLNIIEYVYLGNNNLSGKPPTWLNIIEYVDLSYNYFSGEFSSWMKNSKQKNLNLIENSFSENTTYQSDSNVQDYLQRGFKCKDPMYTSLAINCGGTQWETYEGDSNPLGPSSYFLSSDKKWAVSNTGHFMDAENHKWIVTGNTSEFAKGIDSELYGTARCSSSSLRYYALCLRNGQYNVQLRFAEIVISNGTTFAGLGRRIFDVYIQGSRRLKDFNIKDDARGSYKVVIKNFTVNVTENYLEIHFFWAGKGTDGVPVKGTYGPLVSAIIISTPNSKINSTSSGGNKNNKTMIIGIACGAVIASGFAVCLLFIFIRKRNKTKSRSFRAKDDAELTGMDTISNTFSLEVIQNATDDFNPENKIGEGGFGAVFKGILPDGKTIAVKQMSPNSRQGNREFLNEVGTIYALRHSNLLELYGCCIQGKQLLLVYEYMENNSLARSLFGPKEFRLKLEWPQRYNICIGVARGLAYLHEESTLRIIHRDIKATNILLDRHLNPKISDFGLAKLFDREKTHVSTRVAGTIGYMAPEYALKGQLTDKADVYSFGVVVLEVVSGRTHTEKTLEEEMVYLLEWTRHLYEKKRLLDLVDVNLKSSNYSMEEVLRVINVGLLCTHATPMLRPSMSTVVGMLEGKMEAHVSHSRPPNLGKRQVSMDREEPSSYTEILSLEGPSNTSSST